MICAVVSGCLCWVWVGGWALSIRVGLEFRMSARELSGKREVRKMNMVTSTNWTYTGRINTYAIYKAL